MEKNQDKLEKVEIKIDMENREKLRRLHTATHIVNFSAREILGNHVWQNGSNLKAEEGTLDITHYDNLSFEDMCAIEILSNRVVFENRKVSVEELDRNEAEKKYGFVLYQGGAIPMKTLRVVKVFENDIEACGGIHMLSTGGIGLIKIIESQKIQDGVVRLKFVVNDYALKQVHNDELVLEELKKLYSVDNNSLVRTSEKFFNEWKNQGKEIEKLKKELKNSYVEIIKSLGKNEFKLSGDLDMGFLMDIFNEILISKKSFKLIGDKFIIASSDIEVKDSKKKIPKGNFNIYVM